MHREISTHQNREINMSGKFHVIRVLLIKTGMWYCRGLETAIS